MKVRMSMCRARTGLTLIEMVVVLVILIGLAALLVPRLANLTAQSAFAGSAAGAADVMNNLETHRSSLGRYPHRFDSLLNTDGTVYSKVWRHSSSSEPFTVGALTGKYAAMSLGKTLGENSAGDAVVMDHSESSTDPNNSASTERTLALDGSDNFAMVVSGSDLEAAAGYPDGLPDGVELVAFGIGPGCSAIGKTMASAPACSVADVDEYGRFLAVFACYNSTVKGATLQTVVDCRRYDIGKRVGNYKAAMTQE